MTMLWLSATVALTLFPGVQLGMVRSQPEPPKRGIAAEVRDVFAAKCAICHGPNLRKPKGRFGYVLDLRRVASNPEMVIPRRPDESELWELVKQNEMPPNDSPRGALSLKQKDIIRAWIASGAPDVSPGDMDFPTASRAAPKASASLEATSADRLIHWLGKLHLVLLHFPIALTLAAGVAEVRSVWQRNPLPSEASRFCLWLGALAAVPTVVLGWFFAADGNGAGSPQLLTAHRWLGTAAAVWLVFTAICAERDAHRAVRSRHVRFLLAAGILITALTAHLGGLIVHGEDFFRY